MPNGNLVQSQQIRNTDACTDKEVALKQFFVTSNLKTENRRTLLFTTERPYVIKITSFTICTLQLFRNVNPKNCKRLHQVLDSPPFHFFFVVVVLFEYFSDVYGGVNIIVSNVLNLGFKEF